MWCPHSSFLRRRFFAIPHTRGRMRVNGGNVLTSGIRRSPVTRSPHTSFPPSPPRPTNRSFGDWHWEVVSSYSSATVSDSHGIPSIHSLTYDSQRTAAESNGGGRHDKRNLTGSRCQLPPRFDRPANRLLYFHPAFLHDLEIIDWPRIAAFSAAAPAGASRPDRSASTAPRASCIASRRRERAPRATPSVR